MSAHGIITTWLGHQLQQEPSLQSYSVYYNHGVAGEKNVCEISSVIGNDLRRDNKISEIDIAILDRTEKVIFLIEIEESDDNPKKLVGDVMATLLGDKIFMNGKEKNQIGYWTTLLVLAKGEGESHLNRTKEIENRINKISGASEINKMGIGKIKISLFRTSEDLKDTIMDYLKPHTQND